MDHVFAWTGAVWSAQHFGRELPLGGKLVGGGKFLAIFTREATARAFVALDDDAEGFDIVSIDSMDELAILLEDVDALGVDFAIVDPPTVKCPPRLPSGLPACWRSCQHDGIASKTDAGENSGLLHMRSPPCELEMTLGKEGKSMAEDEAVSPPTAVAEPITLPPLPFVTGIAGFGTVVVACRWAAPLGGDFRFLLTALVVVAVVWGGYLLGLARFRLLRLGLVCVPIVAGLLVRAVAAYLAGGWVGGWLLGMAGVVVGAAAGGVAGWLFVRALADLGNITGRHVFVIGGWSWAGSGRVAGSAASAAVGAAAGFAVFAWLST